MNVGAGAGSYEPRDRWVLRDYLPEVLADDRRRFPAIADIAALIGAATVGTVRIPADCEDGFFHA